MFTESPELVLKLHHVLSPLNQVICLE